MEQGISRLKLAAQVGDQIRREEEPEARLRKETERVRMAVQKACIDTPPILLVLEGTHLFVRLAPFETTLQETPSRMHVPRESPLNLLDHSFSGANPDSRKVRRLTVLHYCGPSPKSCGDGNLRNRVDRSWRYGDHAAMDSRASGKDRRRGGKSQRNEPIPEA